MQFALRITRALKLLFTKLANFLLLPKAGLELELEKRESLLTSFLGDFPAACVHEDGGWHSLLPLGCPCEP